MNYSLKNTAKNSLVGVTLGAIIVNASLDFPLAHDKPFSNDIKIVRIGCYGEDLIKNYGDPIQIRLENCDFGGYFFRNSSNGTATTTTTSGNNFGSQNTTTITSSSYSGLATITTTTTTTTLPEYSLNYMPRDSADSRALVHVNLEADNKWNKIEYKTYSYLRASIG